MNALRQKSKDVMILYRMNYKKALLFTWRCVAVFKEGKSPYI